jgi:flagellar FliL protein
MTQRLESKLVVLLFSFLAFACAGKMEARELGPMQAYPPFVVNLADADGTRYLKVGITLELSPELEFPAEVAAQEARVKDAIVMVLSAKTFDELSTTEGKMALKQDIQNRLNMLMAKGHIQDVYFTDFMMQ